MAYSAPQAFIGDMLGENDDHHLAVLSHFTNTFQFSGASGFLLGLEFWGSGIEGLGIWVIIASCCSIGQCSANVEGDE